MKQNKTSEYIESFLNYLKQNEEDYNIHKNIMELKDKETQDILHKLELEHILFDGRAVLATTLRKIRQERRKSKDIVEEKEPLVNWYNENKSSLNKLRETLGITRKQEKYHTNRVYIQKAPNSN